MNIRYVNEHDDRLKISNIYEKSWKYAYSGIIPQSYLDSIPEGKWAAKIDNPQMHSLVITENKEIIGTSCFCQSRFKEFENYGEIASIYLLPDYIGKGYGHKLLNTATDELRKIGYKDIFLWVLEDNHRARKFYERNGWICSGIYLNDNIGGKDLKELQYCYHI